MILKTLPFPRMAIIGGKCKKICIMELLSTKRVQSFRAIREEEVLNLVKSISLNKTSPINLSKKIFLLTYGVTARAAFGGETKGQEEFVSIVEEVADLIGGFTIVDMYPSVKLFQVISGIRGTLEKMHKRIDQILENIVNDYRERKRTTESGKGEEEDLVDVLLRIQKHGDLEFPLTDNNIKAVILDIFSAGSETPSTIVDWAMSEMLKNPQVMKRAQAEVRSVFDKKGNVDESCLHKLKYLNSVIKETLRLHPSAPLLVPRESSEQCTMNGHDIPAKTKFIPFGAGRRICPGISFAIPNIELPLAQLLYHFDWKLPDGKKYEELDMEEDLEGSPEKKVKISTIYIAPDSLRRSFLAIDIDLLS
ncbi:hypothetical protein ACSBR1_011578 [Camellia fascicularis]